MFSSIRTRLTLWYICILGIVFVAFGIFTYSLLLRIFNDETRINVLEMSANFVTSVNVLQGVRQPDDSAEQLIAETLEDLNFRDYRFAVTAADGKPVANSDGLTDAMLRDVTSSDYTQYRSGEEVYAVSTRPFSLKQKDFRLYVFFSLEDQRSVESRVRGTLLITAPILLLLAGVGGYLLARQSLKPIADMGERAKYIGAQNLHERLPVANPNDEIGDLAVVFNQLLDRLDQEFEKQRRFMADASHELRTPLAIVRGESEVALQKDRRSDEEYRESLRIVNDEARRLSKIVEDLFTLARVDSGSIQANFQSVYLGEITEDCVTKIRTLAEGRRILVTFIGNELIVRGDEALLRRLILNLLDNAVKYNIDGGRIDVAVSGRTVTVSNTGPEIDEDQRKLVFDRFYRIDKAHSRSTGTLTSGAGLGLSIAKWIADLHGANITIDRSQTHENIFSLTFAD